MKADRWLSVREMAAYLGVKDETVYTWASKRRMPAHKVGRLWKFKADEVDAWIRSGRAAVGAKQARSGKTKRRREGEAG